MATRIKKTVNRKLATYFPQYKQGRVWKNYIDRNGEIFFFTEKEAENWLKRINKAPQYSRSKP
jgi:hypothetical protein